MITITIPKLEPISTVELVLLAAMPVATVLTLFGVLVAWDLWQSRQTKYSAGKREDT